MSNLNPNSNPNSKLSLTKQIINWWPVGQIRPTEPSNLAELDSKIVRFKKKKKLLKRLKNK